MPYQIKYPSLQAYHIPSTHSHLSPCMSFKWRAQDVREGIVRDEIEHEDKPELEGEE